MKLLSKALLLILAAGLLYLITAPLFQKILLVRLEKGGEIKLEGENLSPFSLGYLHMRNVTISRQDLFKVTAEEARVHFSPVETLLGQIPLRIDARDLTLRSKEDLLNSAFSNTPIDVLNAKITVFSGKGIAVHQLEVKGTGLKFSAQGKLVKEGKGNSDLTASLWLDPALADGKFRILTQDLFSGDKGTAGSGKPLEFHFSLKGDMAHPVVSLQSDLIRFNVNEKEVAA